MINQIKYSIIIITYNYEKYILDCIRSCLDQTKSINFEIIVVDDGSNDSTYDIIQSIKNKSLRYYKIPNSGIEKASNFGILKSKGDFIVRVDADDLLMPNFLQTMDKKIVKDERKFYYPNYTIINENGVKLKSFSLPPYNRKEVLSRGDFLATGTVFRRKDLKKVGYYSEKLKNCGLENYELIIKLINSNVVGERVPENLFSYRRHQKNISSLKRKEIIKYGFSLFSDYSIGEFKTNENHPYGLII